MSDLTEIKTGQRPIDASSEMAEAIKEVILRYDGTVPLTLVLGVLEIVKVEIIANNG